MRHFTSGSRSCSQTSMQVSSELNAQSYVDFGYVFDLCWEMSVSIDVTVTPEAVSGKISSNDWSKNGGGFSLLTRDTRHSTLLRLWLIRFFMAKHFTRKLLTGIVIRFGWFFRSLISKTLQTVQDGETRNRKEKKKKPEGGQERSGTQSCESSLWSAAEYEGCIWQE